MDVSLVLQFLLALWLGALIGMERGIKYPLTIKGKKIITFWEIRTFALISFLWAMSTWLSLQFQSQMLLITTLVLVWLFIAIYYTYTAFKQEQLGLTTEMTAFITFFLWSFIILWFAKIAVLLSIILTFILSLKWFSEKIINKISREELNNTLKFAVISVVVLPLLPDQKYSISEVLWSLWYTHDINNAIINLPFMNPYGIWFFVVLMAWISYAGYVMSKVIWEKWSIILSGAIGGLVSSTAVTAAMTEASKKDVKNRDLYVISTLTASMIMFIRVILIVLFFNINMLNSIIYPTAFMLIWMFLYMLYFYTKTKKKEIQMNDLWLEKEKYKSPFSIWPALKFAVFILLIKFIAGVGGLYQEVWGNYFFYALWIISGLADVDAVSQTMAVDSLDGKITSMLAAMTIITAVISNNFVKWWIALKFWEKKFGQEVMLWFVISMIMWIIGMWVLTLI